MSLTVDPSAFLLHAVAGVAAAFVARWTVVVVVFDRRLRLRDEMQNGVVERRLDETLLCLLMLT